MPAHVVHANETRRTETANAVMTTLASPTLSNTRDFSVWQVDLGAGARGPVHVMDSEQVWTMLAGDASCVVEEVHYDLTEGDTIRITGGVTRQFVAKTATVFLVCGRSDAQASTPTSEHPVTPPWIA